MAANQPTFSEVLPDIPAPATPDGNLLVRAGQLEGAAARVQGEDKAATTGFLGTVAIEATKGYLEAGASKDINEIVTKFKEDAQKYAEGQRQGLISREEALARIGMVVKQYSAMAPGWAADFRKIGQDLTGIRAVDTYLLEHALTQAGAAERAQAQKDAADLQLSKQIAEAYGLSSISEIQPWMRSTYAANKQSQLQLSALETAKKTKSLNQEEADDVSSAVVQNYTVIGLRGIADEMQKLVVANTTGSQTAAGAQEAGRMGAVLAGKIGILKMQLIQKVDEQTIGPNRMSLGKAKEIKEQISKTLDDYSEFVKTQEGYNWWTQAVKAAKGNTDYMMDRFYQDNPMVRLYKDTGVLPNLMQAWQNVGGDKKKYAAIYGQQAADAMDSVNNSGKEAFTKYLGNLAAGKTDLAHANDEATRDVAYNEVIGGVRTLMEKADLLPEQKQTATNFTKEWMTAFDPSNAANLDKFARVWTSDKAAQFISKLDMADRQKALTPFFDKVNTTLPNYVGAAKEQLAKIGDLDVMKKFGHKVEVVMNPLTMQLEVKETAGEKPGLVTTPGGAVFPGAYAKANIDPEYRAGVQTLQRLVKWLNTAPAVLEKMVPEISKDKPTLNDMMPRILDAINGTSRVNLNTLIKGEPTTPEVPKNPEISLKVEPEQQAQRDEMAAKVRLREGVTQADADLLRNELKSKNLNGTVRDILKRELAIVERALQLSASQQ